jgi:hypothetical protein
VIEKNKKEEKLKLAEKELNKVNKDRINDL